MPRKCSKANLVCQHCGKEYQRYLKHYRPTKSKYCSIHCYRLIQTKPQRTSSAELFQANCGPILSNGCMEWAGFRNNTNYGVLYKNGTKLAHRLAWEVKNGPIPNGMCVLHKCDNPPCVNADHLFLGSRRDNNVDKVQKGRQPKGEATGVAKLTSQQVIEIRKMFITNNRNMAEIGRQFCIARQHIARIIKRKNWSHI